MLESRPILDFNARELTEAVNAGFEHYIVPFHFTPEHLERRMRAEHLDAEASRVFTRDGQPAGVVLVARRGLQSRIAAMGVSQALRGQGQGRLMLTQVLDAARERGDRSVTLEVIAGNAAARALYARCGFLEVRRLLGYRREPEPGRPGVLVETDPADFAALVAREGEATLPWMLAAPTLAASVAPVRAWTLDGSAFALVQTRPGGLLLHALLTRASARREGCARRLLRALVHVNGGVALQLIPVVPEDLAPGFFSSCGFAPLELSQFEMRLDL